MLVQYTKIPTSSFLKNNGNNNNHKQSLKYICTSTGHMGALNLSNTCILF